MIHRFYSLALLAFLLAACGPQPQVERVDLGEASGSSLALTPSPDSKGAVWSISANGKAIAFGKTVDAPYLTLNCALSADNAPRIHVIRHAQSQPGAKVLFPIMGNGTISRLKMDAILLDEGWRWEGSYPASAPEFEVFAGPRDIEATMPGAGKLFMPASSLPREFIAWCRRNGAELPKAAPAPEVTPISPAPDR